MAYPPRRKRQSARGLVAGSGLLRHPAPNLEPGDVVVLGDGREALVTARVESPPHRGWLTALLEVLVAVKP